MAHDTVTPARVYVLYVDGKICYSTKFVIFLQDKMWRGTSVMCLKTGIFILHVQQNAIKTYTIVQL